MAKVIKPFKDGQDGLKLYDLEDNNNYQGERKVELFKKGYVDLTVAEIKEILDYNEVEYNSSDKKQELIKLLG